MKIKVLWFGRSSSGPFENEVRTYQKRVRRRWLAEDVRLRPASTARTSDPNRALKSEAQILRQRVPDRWLVVALAERGTVAISEEFAAWLADTETKGAPGVVFVIGSDLGLHQEVLEKADKVLSLSTMTFSHQIARLLIWEQLFRATHILGGGGYHRPGVQ
jgi:23S rRNA (pseudouridine1915-N3)-methyltransferase